jgi:diacylglycerol kinase
MEILAEALGTLIEGAVDLVGERYGCLAGVLAFGLLLTILVVVVALSI